MGSDQEMGSDQDAKSNQDFYSARPSSYLHILHTGGSWQTSKRNLRDHL